MVRKLHEDLRLWLGRVLVPLAKPINLPVADFTVPLVGATAAAGPRPYSAAEVALS